MKNVLIAFVLTVFCFAMPPRTFAEQDLQGNILWQLQSYRDFRGTPQWAVVDAEGHSYLATMDRLYRIMDGKTQLIAEQREKGSRLAVAPGGGLYAWITPSAAWRGLFSVEILDFSGKDLGTLRLKEFPHGFGSLYLGFQGKLIVTSSPLDDWQGLTGRFRIAFWNRQGEILKSLIIEGRHSAVLDPTGEAILLLGEKEARAFAMDGKELWGLKGQFRKAAITKGGRIALLNPAAERDISQIVIFTGEGEPVVVKAPTPVHGFTITPDGSAAVVIGDKGRYFRMNPLEAVMQEAQRLPIKSDFFIFNAEFVNDKTLVFGILERVGESPKEKWPRADIVIVDQRGNIAFQKDFPVYQTTSFYPAVFTLYGSRYVVGLTQESAALIELSSREVK